eukprot:scaffold32603_cov56-Phaeocystis_antarctica.AAC.2
MEAEKNARRSSRRLALDDGAWGGNTVRREGTGDAPSGSDPSSDRRCRRDGALEAERRRAGHRLQPAVQRARSARRRLFQHHQQRAVGADAGAAAATEG